MDSGAFYLFWFGGAVLVGWYASAKKNHNPLVWFLLAVFFTPILAGLVASLMGPRGTSTPRPFPATPFAPTLRVPLEGLMSWQRPDPAGPSTPLAGGLELAVVHRVDDWAQVRASNNWIGWVDARRLVALAPPPPPNLAPPPSLPTPPAS